MTNPSPRPPNILQLSPDFRILLPAGATGGTGELSAEGSYRVAQLLGGSSIALKLTITDSTLPLLAKVVTETGGPPEILGARLGDGEPPYVTLRIYPTYQVGVNGVIPRGDPIVYRGRPHEYPVGSGTWDLRDLGGEDGPIVVERDTLPDLGNVLTRAEAAADAAEDAVTAAQGAVVAAQGATAQATLAATATLRAAQQSRLINGLYGQRSGRGMPTFERGAAAFIGNDGTGPFSVAESPKMIRFGWPAGVQDSTAYTSFRAKATPAFDPAGPLSASAWLRLSDLDAATAVELLLFGYAAPGQPTALVSGPGFSPEQLATPGFTYTGTSSGVEATCTVGAVRGGWAQVTFTTAAGLGAGTTFVEFLVRVRTSGAGKVDLMAPAVLNLADAIAPQALPRDVLDLSPEDAARLPVLGINEFRHIGDSITTSLNYVAGGEAATWRAKLAARRGWTQYNYGMNGSNVCSPGADGGQPMVDRVAQSIPDGYAGGVTLWGGTNDWNNAANLKDPCPLGLPGSTDKSNYYGALLTAGRSILRRGPCFLALLTPLWRGDPGRTEGTRVGGWTLEQYRQAVRDVAAQLAGEYPGRVQLIDIGRDLADAFSGPGGYMNGDNLHPNDAGQTLIAQYLDMRLPRFVGPRYPANGEATVFGQLAAGSALAGQLGWTAHAGAVATVSADRAGLTLTAPFDGAPSGNPATSPAVLHDLPAGVRRVTMQINPLAQSNSGAILRAFHNRATNRAICAWILNGGQLDFGVIAGGATEGNSWIGNGGPVIIGPSTVEILREGGRIEVRHWPADQPRPDEPTRTHDDVTLVADAYGLSTIGAAAQPSILSVTVAG